MKNILFSKGYKIVGISSLPVTLEGLIKLSAILAAILVKTKTLYRYKIGNFTHIHCSFNYILVYKALSHSGTTMHRVQ